MADVGEISMPVASIIAAESPSAPRKEHTSGGSQRTRVSPLSEAAGQIVDVIIRNSESEEGVTRSSSDSGGTSQETVQKQTADAKETETCKLERSGCNADPQDTALKQDESAPDDPTKPQKSPSQTALVSEDTDILQIAGMQMGALKTLNTLMMSSRYLELILVPKSDLVEEKKPSDEDGDGSTVSTPVETFVIRIFGIVQKS